MLFKNIALLAVATASIVVAAPVAIDAARGSDLAAINANVPDVSTYGFAGISESDYQGDDFPTKSGVTKSTITPEQIAEIVKEKLKEPIARLGLTEDQGDELIRDLTNAVIEDGAKSPRDVEKAINKAIDLLDEKIKEIEEGKKSCITKFVDRIKAGIDSVIEKAVMQFVLYCIYGRFVWF